MSEKHWSDEDLVNRLYEVDSDDRHLGECEGCRERWLGLVERRVELMSAAEPAPEFFVRQQQQIMRRIDKPAWHSMGLRLATAAASLAIVGAGLLFVGQNGTVAPSPASLSAEDRQLQADIAALSEVPTSQATKPITALFNQ